ncbi:hypothetical protein ES319_D11G269900v1 [Gossypium barbadense]|uniref:CNNM transmembrane domain-containing protein n=2 Tax=Gossypium TaxID=3633 RepID=A0A5J5PG74_GOSBA|nr:hypothetical protein ES319_D11G269900v1 [Gossypium barbadense]TYG46783.1 hypothetical protein ES288_D11G283900v1 [Gossypium darwinii]
MVAVNLLISLVCCSPSLVLPSHQKPEGILAEFLFLLIFVTGELITVLFAEADDIKRLVEGRRHGHVFGVLLLRVELK